MNTCDVKWQPGKCYCQLVLKLLLWKNKIPIRLPCLSLNSHPSVCHNAFGDAWATFAIGRYLNQSHLMSVYLNCKDICKDLFLPHVSWQFTTQKKACHSPSHHSQASPAQLHEERKIFSSTFCVVVLLIFNPLSPYYDP